jgi:predicted Zn-dependent peptidase
MRDWYEQKIQKAPRVLAVFGDVDPDQVQKLAADLLGKGDRRPAPQPPDNAPAPQTEGSQQASVNVVRVAVQKTEQELAGVAIGYKSTGVIGDAMNYPMTMADTLTSGYTYPTGYLFETLRGQKLVYVADAVDRPGRSGQLPGNFMAFAGCEPKNVDRVVDLILENIARLQGTPKEIDTTWFGRAKDLVLVADAMEHETPAAQAQLAAVDEALGLGYAYHEQFADHIRAVTLPQVQQVARQRLRECLVTISTPNPELVHVKPGVRTYRSFPPIDLTPRGVQHDTGAGGK